MGGLGNMPLGAGPYGGVTPPEPTEPVTTVVSCRLIDGVTRDYVTDDNGNPEAQDGTANRVYLLLAYSDVRSEIITKQGLAARQAAVRKALLPLTSGQAPAISKLDVVPADGGGDRVTWTITYFNNQTQTAKTIPL